MISMPHPCSEDFSKMTPTAKGAFCGKCSTETIDLFKLTKSEMNQVFLKAYENKEEVCGRISNHQMSSLNRDFRKWQKSNRKSLQSKFLFALLISFGLTMFSCSSEEAKFISELNSKINIEVVDNKINSGSIIVDEQVVDLINFVDIEEELDNQLDLVAEPAVVMDTTASELSFLDSEVKKDTTNWNALINYPSDDLYPIEIRGSAIRIEDQYYEYLLDTLKNN